MDKVPDSFRKLLDLSIAELHTLYKAGDLSPVQVSDALFDAIAADGGRINAFCVLDRDGALSMAKAAEQRYQRQASLGPLDGVPVSIKDLIDLQGWPTRRGSLLTAGQPPANRDAPSTGLLRRAGAVLFGKTTTSEFGWAAHSESPYTGITHNPRAPGKSAGGSSAGAAAQVAMGWGPLALGSDAGGSIRIPASYCGLVGFKPTFGAIPLGPQSAFAEFAHLGPITRTVEDCRLAMQVLAAPDPLDPHSLYARLGVVGPAQPVLGYVLDAGEGTTLDPAIAHAMENLVESLRRQGYSIRNLRFDWTALAEDFWNIWQNRIFESFVDTVSVQRALLEPRLQTLFEAGAALDSTTLARSRSRLRSASALLAQNFTEIDLLLTPASPAGAPDIGTFCPVGHPLHDRIAQTLNWPLANPYAFPFNLTQQPALAMPLDFTAAKLPFGLQIVGRKYHDDAVLDFASLIANTHFHKETAYA